MGEVPSWPEAARLLHIDITSFRPMSKTVPRMFFLEGLTLSGLDILMKLHNDTIPSTVIRDVPRVD